MKKSLVLKNWVVKVLGWVLGGYVGFTAITIDNLFESKVYNLIFITWTILAIISFILLNKYSKVFEN